MSHELRAALNSVIGISELLEQELAGPMTPKQVDPVCLGQVLYNLLSNGIKFTPAGGAWAWR